MIFSTRVIITASLSISCSAAILAQPENANWVFGSAQGITFQTGDPVFYSSAGTSAVSFQPAVISDEDGELVCYTDGDKVYNFNNEEIENGDLVSAKENLIVPAPDMPGKYFLIRSGSMGLVYCIIDMNMNDGAGGIAPGDVDITLSGYSCQVVSSLNTNGQDSWLITVDNSDGNTDNVHFVCYQITSEGINMVSEIEQYYIFGGWYAQLEDLRISPDCSKLAAVYKGHYLVLCQFNHETGEFFDLFFSSLDLGTSFVDVDQIEFSPNSEYLYSLGDQHSIKQYSVAVWDLASISASAYVVIDGGWGSVDTWTDMKLGPDNKLYLHNIQDDQLDVITNPDEPGENIVLTEAVMSNLDLTSFFPNTPNLLCASPLDVGVFHQYECLGDSTEFWYSLFTTPDSVAWNFGDPETEMDNFSNLNEPIHVFSETGTYDVMFYYYLDGVVDSLPHEVNIYPYPVVNLPATLNLCEGETVTLDAGNPGYSYDWTNGANTQTITVSAPGIYGVEVNNNGCIDADETEVIMIPMIDFGPDDSFVVCDGEPIEIDLTASGAYEFEWNTGATTPSIVVTQSGVYEVTASNECFEAEQEFTVSIINIPDVLLPGNMEACAGESITLTSSYTQGTIMWSTGESTSSITVTESGVYLVTINQLGCTASDDVEVAFSDFVPLDQVIMPNIFTPSGDGDNERFRPFLKNNHDYDLCASPVLEVDLQVYDRWGMMYADDVCSWNGENENGNLMSSGTFYYIIKLGSACQGDAQEKKLYGYFELVGQD